MEPYEEYVAAEAERKMIQSLMCVTTELARDLAKYRAVEHARFKAGTVGSTTAKAVRPVVWRRCNTPILAVDGVSHTLPILPRNGECH